MKICMIRHGKVDYIWKPFSTSAEYDADCRGYDEAPITKDAYSVPSVDYQKIYISTLPRSREMAVKLFGEQDFVVTDLAVEVPLFSGFDTNARLPKIFWDALGRVQWELGIRRQPEIRNDTIRRADRLAEMLEESGEDAVVVSHGFFMKALAKAFKKRGFEVRGTHIYYRNGDAVVAEK